MKISLKTVYGSETAAHKAPESLKDLWPILLAGLKKNLVMKLVIAAIVAGCTFVLHTYLLIGPNGGFWMGTSKVLDSILALRTSRDLPFISFGSAFSAGLFWFLIAVVVWRTIGRIIKYGAGKFGDDLKWEFKTISDAVRVKPGSRELTIILAGFTIALFIGILIGNFVLNLLIAIALFLSMSAGKGGFFYLRLGFADAKKLFHFDKPEKFDAVKTNIFEIGMIAGFLLSFLMINLPFYNISKYILLVIAIGLTVWNEIQHSNHIKTVVMLLIGLIPLIVIKKVFADDGGWAESGSTLAGWLAGPGALPALNMGLAPALLSGLGTALGLTMGDILPASGELTGTANAAIDSDEFTGEGGASSGGSGEGSGEGGGDSAATENAPIVYDEDNVSQLLQDQTPSGLLGGLFGGPGAGLSAMISSMVDPVASLDTLMDPTSIQNMMNDVANMMTQLGTPLTDPIQNAVNAFVDLQDNLNQILANMADTPGSISIGSILDSLNMDVNQLTSIAESLINNPSQSIPNLNLAPLSSEQITTLMNGIADAVQSQPTNNIQSAVTAFGLIQGNINQILGSLDANVNQNLGALADSMQTDLSSLSSALSSISSNPSQVIGPLNLSPFTPEQITTLMNEIANTLQTQNTGLIDAAGQAAQISSAVQNTVNAFTDFQNNVSSLMSGTGIPASSNIGSTLEAMGLNYNALSNMVSSVVSNPSQALPALDFSSVTPQQITSMMNQVADSMQAQSSTLMNTAEQALQQGDMTSAAAFMNQLTQMQNALSDMLKSVHDMNMSAIGNVR